MHASGSPFRWIASRSVLYLDNQMIPLWAKKRNFFPEIVFSSLISWKRTVRDHRNAFMSSIKQEAVKCLKCKKAQCSLHYPVSTDVPRVMEL